MSPVIPAAPLAISAHSSDEKLACTFIMNGGEISNNRCGSLGGAIAASSGIIYMELNGGRISGNVTNAATSAAVYHGSKSGYMKLTGVCFEDNLTASGVPSASAYASYGETGRIEPNANGTLTFGNYLQVNNSNTSSGKLIYYTTSTGLEHLNGSLDLMMKNLYVGAVILAGADGYTLTEADMAKIHLLNDIEGAYQVELDAELNQIVLAEIPNNDIIVYLNGASGKDENDGLTVKTAVKTLEKAKQLLKERVAAAESIPEDANFVISLAGKVTITENTTMTFADFGADVNRCMIRRDASFTSGQMFGVSACDVVLEDVVIDGNLAFVKENSASMFSMNDGATLTMNDGAVIRNYASKNMGGLFYLSSGKQRGDTTLTFNGGHIYNVSGGSGAIALLWGSMITDSYKTKCVVNQVLLEDCTCTTGMFFVRTGGTLTFNGGTFRNNTATTAGSLASVWGEGVAQVIFNTPDEGTAMDLHGDVYLLNATEDSMGNTVLAEDCVVYTTGRLGSKIGITATLSTWNTPVLEGLGYTLTEEDLEQVYMTTGDVLKLNPKTNQMIVAKSMN